MNIGNDTANKQINLHPLVVEFVGELYCLTGFASNNGDLVA